MSWEFGSLRVFICSYVLYSFGLIFRYIFRFLHLGDAKSELIVSPSSIQGDGTERNQFLDSEIDGFRQELVDFLFWSEEREEETDCSVFMEGVPDVHKESKKVEGEKTDCSVLRETNFDDMKTEVHKESTISKEIESEIHEEDGPVFMESDSANFIIHEDDKENEEAEESDSMVIDSDYHEDGKKINEDETNCSVFIEKDFEFHHVNTKKEEGETEEPVSLETDSDVHEDGKKIEENETESFVLMENISVGNEDSKKINEIEKESCVFNYDEPHLHHNSKREELEEEEKEGPVLLKTDSLTTTNKCEHFSGKDISGFMEEPTTLRFSFREFYMGPDVLAISDNAYANTEIIADKDFPEFDSEKDPVVQEQEQGNESVQEHVSIPSTNIQSFQLGSEAFGGTDSSDEDYFLFNENSLTSDSESESSSSSGLIWGNSEKVDDSIAYQFLGGKNGEGFESEILKLMMRDERTEDLKEKQSSCEGKFSEFGVHGISSENGYIEMEPSMKKSMNIKDTKAGLHHEKEACQNGKVKTEQARWEEELNESESDEDDFEWEHDDLVEQLKMELRNSRQGGLATILEEEEEEEEEEETQSPKVVEDLKPLKFEEKLEYTDQIDEIEKVYKRYAEKMKKLDVLNYQTLHALGLLQLKDPLKLISIPKSTIQGVKPIISQNLWSRKGSKISSDPLLKFVHELHRDLELVYVGQVCLSWEILSWLFQKAHELQQYNSEGSHRYNLVAGEFQLFQVLVQRFIENEPYQGSTRIQNYVKNRCVIRNLLQVPAIKDDDSKGGEKDTIGSGKLTEIIKESMRVFWEFIRADKDYGNVIFKVSKQIGTDIKEPAISALLVDIRTRLQKKERKLKDIVRSGNCIVKKFQKQHEDQLDHEQLVAQVGLRLISRVVHMSKLRKEQVIWCNEKLHRIKFLSRKIVEVEPSFLLFPC